MKTYNEYFKTFPNLYKITENAKKQNSLRPQLHYGIVQNGKIVVSDGLIMAYHDLAIFGVTPENANCKVFSTDLLKKLTAKNIEKITFCEDGILLSYKKEVIINGIPECSEHLSYSGYIDAKNAIYTIKNSLVGCYPSWQKVIPGDNLYKESKECIFALNTNHIKLLTDCFSFHSYDKEKTSLVFECYDNKRPLRISVQAERGEKYRQYIILTPMLIFDLCL